jgi:hypothetical protein
LLGDGSEDVQYVRTPLIWAIASINLVSGDTTKGSLTMADWISIGVRAGVGDNISLKNFYIFLVFPFSQKFMRLKQKKQYSYCIGKIETRQSSLLL